MKQISVVQGSDEWLAHRRNTRNASDAPVMMGASKNISRRTFERLCATGMEREFSDYVKNRILEKGHEVEPKLRALAESIIGQELYPVTAVSDDGYLGASLDGITMDESIIFEAKQTNAAKQAALRQGEIPAADLWQLVQQFAVCESAQKCLYLCGDGTEEGTARLTIFRAHVESSIPKLIAGWKQFDQDVAAYQPESVATEAVGVAPDALPTLSVVARGVVEFSNMAEFREKAMAAIAGVNTDLQTDDDFATAELTVKAFKAGEEKLEATKAQILGQMADVDAVMRTIDEVSAKMRSVRLDLDKRVKFEKENRRNAIVQKGFESVKEFYDGLNSTIGIHAISLSASCVIGELNLAIKGKKSLISIQDAVSSAVAHAKIEATQKAEQVRKNIHVMEMEVGHYDSLFPDKVTLCATKTPEDLRNLITARIADYEAAEKERLAKKAEAAPAADAPVIEAAPVKAEAVATTYIKLVQINELISPLSVTLEGLKQLGFIPEGSKTAKNAFTSAQFYAIKQTLQRRLAAADITNLKD